MGVIDVFVHDLRSGRTTRVSVGVGGAEASGPSFAADISADRRYALFPQAAAGMPGADGANRVYLHDRRHHRTTPVAGDGPAASSAGAPGASLSDAAAAWRSSPASQTSAALHWREDRLIHYGHRH